MSIVLHGDNNEETAALYSALHTVQGRREPESVARVIRSSHIPYSINLDVVGSGNSRSISIGYSDTEWYSRRTEYTPQHFREVLQ